MEQVQQSSGEALTEDDFVKKNVDIIYDRLCKYHNNCLKRHF
jgi:hypothetical protein